MVHWLVRRLADARLLVTGQDPRTNEETVEIIHDALLREWGRPRRWMTEQREFYLWRQRLGERLQEWKDKGQDEGALLAEAERRLSERADDLNPNERGFIETSAARAKRSRRLLIGGVTVTFLVVSLLALLFWGQRNLARDAAATAEARRQGALAQQLAAQAELERSAPSGSLTLAGLLSVESLRYSPNAEAYTTIYRILARLAYPITRIKHEDSISSVTFSPDGLWIASGSSDGTVRVREAATGQEITRIEHEGKVNAVAFSPDCRWVVSAHAIERGGAAVVWEAITGKEVARMRHEGGVSAVAFSPDCRWVVSGNSTEYGGTAVVWEGNTGEEIARLNHEYEGDDTCRFDPVREGMNAVAFGPNGRWVVTSLSGHIHTTSFSTICPTGWTGGVRVWDATSGELMLDYPGRGVNAVAFSPDGQYIVLDWNSEAGNSYLWGPYPRVGGAIVIGTGSGHKISNKVHENWVESVAFSPDGRWVVSADSTAIVWDAATGREVARIEHGTSVVDVAFSSDGLWVVSASSDGMVRVWEAATGQEMARVEHQGSVTAVEFDPDGKQVVSASSDGTISVWVAAAGWEVTETEHRNSVVAETLKEMAGLEHEAQGDVLAVSPDGRIVVSCSQEDEPHAGIFLLAGEAISAGSAALAPQEHAKGCVPLRQRDPSTLLRTGLGVTLPIAVTPLRRAYLRPARLPLPPLLPPPPLPICARRRPSAGGR